MTFRRTPSSSLHDLRRPGSRPASPIRRRVAFLLPLLVVGSVSAASAQRVEVVQEENFRTEPNGALVGVLDAGTALAFVQRRDNWIEATMEGWIWTRSLQTTDRAGFDVVVIAEEGENLRDRPQGEILGRVETGTLLEEVERIPGWIRVRRRGWIWSASVSVDESASAPDAGVSPARVTGGSGTPSRPAAPAEIVRGGLPVLSAPDGDTLSVLAPDAEVAVLSRQGNWARVRIEGWVWQPPGAGPPTAGEEIPAASGPLTPAAAMANPEAFRGRLVTWELQFISQERAEPVRTDFYEGEPYLLTRPAGDAGNFVYVALPPELVREADGLVPLERITVVGRLRTGRSSLTGHPILDLIEVRGRRR